MAAQRKMHLVEVIAFSLGTPYNGEVYTQELDPKQEGATATSRIPLWLA
jgi:hypothetical protein